MATRSRIDVGSSSKLSKCGRFLLTDSITVDKVLEACFQLLSLFYLTIGRNNEAPATYALTSTIKRLLDHLVEVDLYSAKDLGSIRSSLSGLCNSIQQASTNESTDNQHSPYMLTLLSNRLKLCNATLEKLETRLERIPESLLATHEKIISILRCISHANTKAKVGDITIYSGSGTVLTCFSSTPSR